RARNAGRPSSLYPPSAAVAVCSTHEGMLTMSPTKAAPAVRFEATLYAIDGWTTLRLPEKASNQLPSRGQVAVQATVDGHACQTVVEPDGESGHWVRIDAKQQRAAALRAGDTAEVELVPLEDWPEPKVPLELQAAVG